MEKEIIFVTHNIGKIKSAERYFKNLKFKETFLKEQEKLTLEGNIVFPPNFFTTIKKEKITSNTKKMLDKIHRQKIDMSDEILVINVDGYIGESTKSEIEYALKNGKAVKYLEEI